MRERHGIPNARKIAVSSTDKQSVHVTDADGEVHLSLGSSSYPAGMTPEQAVFIADQLRAAAERVRKAKVK
jgi:hypothetical protein